MVGSLELGTNRGSAKGYRGCCSLCEVGQSDQNCPVNGTTDRPMRDLNDLLYFACCPTHCAAKHCAQTLVPVLPGLAPRPRIFRAVFPSRRGSIPAVRRFLDFLGEASS